MFALKCIAKKHSKIFHYATDYRNFTNLIVTTLTSIILDSTLKLGNLHSRQSKNTLTTNCVYVRSLLNMRS